MQNQYVYDKWLRIKTDRTTFTDDGGEDKDADQVTGDGKNVPGVGDQSHKNTMLERLLAFDRSI